MSVHEGPQQVGTDIDERLRAAAGALRESSRTQVDAAIGLREILHSSRAPDDPPAELTGTVTAPRPSPSPRLLRSPQRVALGVNLLLVLVLGILIARVATLDRELATARPATTSPATPTTATPATVAKSLVPATTVVPQQCLEAAELADEVISRLNRNVRDRRLFSALRDYTVSSQACRRAASP